MTNRSVTALAVSVSLALAASASAQERDEAVEITPHVSVGSAASMGVGAAVRFPVGANFSLEVETAHRSAEMNTLGTHVSLAYDLPAFGRVRPYLATGLGIDQYAVPYLSPTGVITTSQTALTLNAGGGIRVPVDDTWGFRTDARWFNGVGRNVGERWRVYNGVTIGRRSR